jgi:hypothetical protein
VLVRAAIAAAQEETPELELLTAHAVRAGDEAAAKDAYRALLDVWQAADRTRPELIEAERAIGTTGGGKP